MDQKALDSIFEDVDKMNPDGAVLSEHSLSLVDEWIDTGSMALNAICSGSLYKGLPLGRVVGLGGPKGCGKTYIMNQTIGNFQRGDSERWGVVWDSEMAEDAQSAASVGADPSRIKHYPIDNVLHMRNQISKFLTRVIETGQEGKFIIGIVSQSRSLNARVPMSDASLSFSTSDCSFCPPRLPSESIPIMNLPS